MVGNVRELAELLPAFNLTNDPRRQAHGPHPARAGSEDADAAVQRCRLRHGAEIG
jgi:hypothetical protein